MAAKTVRFTITVPIDLKKRMEAAAGLANWSAVASRAFEGELMAIELRRKSSMTRQDVVKRLKAAQEKDVQEDYADGQSEEPRRRSCAEWRSTLSSRSETALPGGMPMACGTPPSALRTTSSLPSGPNTTETPMCSRNFGMWPSVKVMSACGIPIFS